MILVQDDQDDQAQTGHLRQQIATFVLRKLLNEIEIIIV